MTVEVAEVARGGAATKRPKLRKWLVYGLSAGALVTAIGGTLLAINWPFTSQALIDVLQERSVRSVTIGSFRRTYFPPGCEAERICFLHRKHKDKPPLITIDKLVVKGSYWGLISPQKHLPAVRVYGMHVTVPPSPSDGQPNPVMPLTHGAPGRPLEIGKIVADGATLDFVQRTPGKPPIRLTIRKLAIKNVGNDVPLYYHASIQNADPPATIESAGQFGTWDADDPANTPVHGWFRVAELDLGVYGMISGTLKAAGSFSGKLGAIDVKGKADVPNFQVTDTPRSRDLQAQFDTTIAATDGNIDLHRTTARFDRTSIDVSGAIRGQSNEPGKAVSLHIHSVGAHIDDLLKLVISAQQAPMTGDAFFDANLTLPQGAKSFLHDMQVKGTFRVVPSVFTNPDIEQDLARISNDATRKDHRTPRAAATPECAMDGSVSVKSAVAELYETHLNLPGAIASLNGTYALSTYLLQLHGTLQTDGSPAAATTGFKSILLKALTPLLQKKDGRRVLPFKIAGTYQDARLELDLGRKAETTSSVRK